MYTTSDYSNNYLIKIFKYYIAISTAVFILLAFKFIYINPALLLPIIFNVIIYYFIKYGANILLMTHIFILILAIVIITTAIYVSHQSILSLMVMVLMYPYLAFSLLKVESATIYSIVIFSILVVMNKYFAFLSLVSDDIVILFYATFIVSALFFAISKILQNQNIFEISDYLNKKIYKKQLSLEKSRDKINKLYEQIDNLKIKDDNTGFYKKDLVLEFLDNEVIRSIRYKHELSIAIMKIQNYDTMKTINDQEVIDEIFHKISNVIKKIIRQGDIIGHLDQETFICLLPHTVGKNADIFANKLISGIEDIQVQRKTIQAKIGISTIDGNNYDMQTIIKKDGNKIVAQMLASAKQAIKIAKTGDVNRLHIDLLHNKTIA